MVTPAAECNPILFFTCKIMWTTLPDLLILPHVDENFLKGRDIEVTDLWSIINYAAADKCGLKARNASGGKTGHVNFLISFFHLNKEVCDSFHFRIWRPGGKRKRLVIYRVVHILKCHPNISQHPVC